MLTSERAEDVLLSLVDALVTINSKQAIADIEGIRPKLAHVSYTLVFTDLAERTSYFAEKDQYSSFGPNRGLNCFLVELS
jgi:hypothetical protein